MTSPHFFKPGGYGSYGQINALLLFNNDHGASLRPSMPLPRQGSRGIGGRHGGLLAVRMVDGLSPAEVGPGLVKISQNHFRDLLGIGVHVHAGAE